MDSAAPVETSTSPLQKAQPADVPSEKYRSRIAATLLAILGGSFGLHRFFLGQWWGIFYIVFCWTMIPTCVSLIEGIVFLSSSQSNWNKKYNPNSQVTQEAGAIVIVLAFLIPFVMLPLAGIMLAISLPAYQHYNLQRIVEQADSQAVMLQHKVAQYYAEQQTLPLDNTALNVQRYPASGDIALQDVYEGRIRIEFNSDTGVNGALIYYPSVIDGDVRWDCSDSTLDSVWLPEKCKQP